MDKGQIEDIVNDVVDNSLITSANAEALAAALKKLKLQRIKCGCCKRDCAVNKKVRECRNIEEGSFSFRRIDGNIDFWKEAGNWQ